MDPKRILVITAHADDAEFFAGATLAKFAAKGAVIEEVITTDNGRGSFELSSTLLVEQSRQIEAIDAAKVIGKSDVYFLGYPDGFCGDTPVNELREIFMRHIRRFRPDILFTFDPWAPYETHPDHRQVAMAAVEAMGFAHLPLYHPEHFDQGLQPHLTIESYLFAKNGERCNHVEDVSDFIDKKIDSLCAHESQIKMMIDDFKLTLDATGGHKGLLPLLDRNNFRPALEMMIRAWAESVGKPAGFEYAEEFRYVRADDIFKIGDSENSD
jgi:LmbE family N-acetylglucosaminyl deacetylase